MDTFTLELKSKKSLIFFILAALIFFIGTFAQYRKSVRSTNNDFRVYYKTSQRIEAKDWAEIYTRKDGPFPYRYVPYTLPAISWMEQFPEQTSRKIWLVIQASSFLAGFIFLYKSLALTKSEYPLLAVSVSLLLTFRQYMDGLYSGQIAGIVFLSFCLGMYFYLKHKSILDGMANSAATSLKIMPGFLLIHGLIKAKGFSGKVKFLLAGVLLFVVLNVILLVWLNIHDSTTHYAELWNNWVSIVMADGEYFDGSTPKSQSLRAFILRTLGKTDCSEKIWKCLLLAGFCGVVFHWIKNNSVNALQNAYSYSLGILAFILLMPESLPYQLMNIAIPLAVFISDSKLKTSRFHKMTLVLFMICISFASTDFIGRSPSDWMQAQSFAFLVMCLLTFITVKESSVKNQVVRT